MITRNIYYWSMIESMVFTQVAWMLPICLNYRIFIALIINFYAVQFFVYRHLELVECNIVKIEE
jgi:hypothetical protein